MPDWLTTAESRPPNAWIKTKLKQNSRTNLAHRNNFPDENIAFSWLASRKSPSFASYFVINTFNKYYKLFLCINEEHNRLNRAAKSSKTIDEVPDVDVTAILNWRNAESAGMNMMPNEMLTVWFQSMWQEASP